MKRTMKISIGIAGGTLLTSLVLSQVMCRTIPHPPAASPSDNARSREAVATTTVATTVPAERTSVRVCIVMVVRKQYGVLARLFGKENITVTDQPYDAGRSWWDNPMVIYEDALFPNGGVMAGANAAAISGQGNSSNVSIETTLVPHADVTLKTLAKSDCMKGALTVTISTVSEYYDGHWTPMATAKDKALVFAFDTSDKSRQLRPAGSETRTMPPFTFERYTRDHEKWEPKSAWPAQAKSGDWRCTIEVKDVKLAITGYQYIDGKKDR